MSDAVIASLTGRDDFDPLDAVMGEDWGILDIPAKLRGPIQRYAFDLQQKVGRSVGRGGASGSGASSRLTTAFLARKPQSLVKLIRNGGTSDARGLRDQMDYLRKEGTVQLERSDRYLGAVIDEEMEAHIRSFWEIADDGEGKADRTSHIVVSFPIETDHNAAYRAGRDWAEAMFASGHYGDHFDYYTAFHTDREHPHMHVVVNRRGLQEGDWLKISPRGHFDYDEMRFVQVRVAARHGIELEASPRFVRGITERPFADCEHQRAQREGRRPQRRVHNAVSRLQLMLQRSIFARQVRADIEHIDDKHPDIAEVMDRALEHIQSGLELKAAGPRNPISLGGRIGFGEIQAVNNEIEEHRDRILEKIAMVDDKLSGLADDEARVELERRASVIKGQASRFMPDIVSLRDHGKFAPNKAYRGVEAYDDYSSELVADGYDQIRTLAIEAGLAGDIMVARYKSSNGVSRAVADDWQTKERGAITSRLEQTGLSLNEARSQADERVAAFHISARKIFEEVERSVQAYEGRRSRLIEALAHEPTQSDADYDINNRFVRTMKDTLTSDQRRALEAGDISALSAISKNPDQQAQLARRYLETEFLYAEGARKGQLEQALGRIDDVRHEIELRAKENQSKDRGRNNARRDDGGFGL